MAGVCLISVGDRVDTMNEGHQTILQQRERMDDHLYSNATRLISGEKMAHIFCNLVSIEDTRRSFGDTPPKL